MAKLFFINCLLFICFCNVYPQAGYMGIKKNEIQADVFDVLMQNGVNVEYKRYLTKYLGLTFSVQYVNTQKDILFAEEETDEFSTPLTDFGNVAVQTLGYSGGIIYAPSKAGVPLPYGSYFALSFYQVKGNYTELWEPTNKEVDYSVKTSGIRILLGKKIFLFTESLTFEYGLLTGIAWGRVTGNHQKNPYTLQPMVNMTMYNYDYQNDEYRKSINSNFTKFIFMPKVKLGFLF